MDMNKLLGNLNAIENGTFEGPAKQESNEMKKILESFDAAATECGDMPMQAPAPMAPQDDGQPVSINVNLNAKGKENVEDLMALIKAVNSGAPSVSEPQGDAPMQKLKAIMLPKAEDEETAEDCYANEPEEEYKDTQYMTRDLAGGLNKEKNAHPKAADGDNPMALEAKLRAELKSMYEAKKKTVETEKQKGVDGKACWKGYKRMGTKKKGGKTVDNCVKA
jgi:hypothetical protein